jgi:hypothetical protein
MREEPMPMPRDPSEHHVSLGVDTMETVDYFRKRIEEAGHPVEIVDHGYCYSCYTQDPNGMVVEISTIVPNGIEILEQSALTAEADLENWLAGVRDPNNFGAGRQKFSVAWKPGCARIALRPRRKNGTTTFCHSPACYVQVISVRVRARSLPTNDRTR